MIRTYAGSMTRSRLDRSGRGGTSDQAPERSSGAVRTLNLGAGPLRVLGEGEPLEPVLRREMEALFQADFSGVRVYVGPTAPAMGALAFTLGEEIHFAPGMYDPRSSEGVRLIGHELAHVVQQRVGRVRNPYEQGVAIVQDSELEAEAERWGQQAVEAIGPGRGWPARGVIQLYPIQDNGDSYYDSDYPNLKLELIRKLGSASAIYRIVTKDHPMSGREVGYDEGVYYERFQVEESLSSLEIEPGSQLDLSQFKDGWDPKTSQKIQDVGIDLGHGVLTGTAPVVLRTADLIGCAAFLLQAPSAGFLAHVGDRSGNEEVWKNLKAWANDAVGKFEKIAGVRPTSLIIVYNPAEVPNVEWLEYLVPDAMIVTWEKESQISTIIERREHVEAMEWRFDVTVPN
jgi:hypothetical protein